MNWLVKNWERVAFILIGIVFFGFNIRFFGKEDVAAVSATFAIFSLCALFQTYAIQKIQRLRF